MGEVVVISEEAVNLEVKEVENLEVEVEVEAEENEKKEDCTTAVVRWEKFVPRMVLRVLLVEADDSTRQIIAALLRKCSYRVASVSDGLKAWELLKGKPHNVDLILTEVDLPSISGFALLTLIAKHKICKNIPVIMMSSNDSVSMVYKCMLRGAADFLVKPVRKNELRNLWQHVWRRQSSASSEHGPPEQSVAQQKVEATAENYSASNYSSGYMACTQDDDGCVERGSDDQSSCTKPEFEVERTYKDANVVTQVEDVATRSEKDCANIVSEACGNDNVLENSSREAMDLIGAFDSPMISIYRSSGLIHGTKKVDSSPKLDLSLRRFQASSSLDEAGDERHTLNHSDASAFSRYIIRALQPLHPSASNSNQQKYYGTNSYRPLANLNRNNSFDPHGLQPRCQQNMFSVATTQSEKTEVNFPCPQQTVITVPVPVRGMRFDSLFAAYDSAMQPIYCRQSALSPVRSPGSVSAFHSSNLEASNSQQFHNLIDQSANHPTNQIKTKQRHKLKLESSEDGQHLSSATDQSSSSSFCDGTANHLNGIGCGINVDGCQVPSIRVATKCGSQEGFHTDDRNCNRSVQREAAITKFRLKRKDRCFDKKVRYESRKKLAEQRPRVKGQFVRHVHTEVAPPHLYKGSVTVAIC